jgi:hypothetical protein
MEIGELFNFQYASPSKLSAGKANLNERDDIKKRLNEKITA